MSTDVITCTRDTQVDEALDLLVQYKISGIPVVDEESRLLGVVSDFDLLAMDEFAFSKQDRDTSIFPNLEEEWDAFKVLKRLLLKVGGKNIGDIMTSDVITVRPTTNIHDAVRIMLENRLRRLVVVDQEGKVVGLLSRSNIVSTILAQHKALKLHVAQQ